MLTIAEFSPVLTVPPVHSDRHELASVTPGSSEGHFFLSVFSFIASPRKEKFTERKSSGKDSCVAGEQFYLKTFS